MERWITNYILPMSDDTPWIIEQNAIKKAIPTFVANFLWLFVRYRFCMTVAVIY